MRQTVPYLRVFVSSPGDVMAERKIALDVIERLQYRPVFRDKVAFRVIAWDKPGAGTPMRATLTPQEAINQGLPKPSECDIVIVLFWSRMGTKFEMDGNQYESGTHWELMDALDSDRPKTLIYKRTEEVTIKMSDSQRKAKQEQYDRVEAFMKGDLFYAADGSILRGINFYGDPEDFRQQFELGLEQLVDEILKEFDDGATAPPPPDPVSDDSDNITTFEPKTWEGSPFPGLRAFTEKDSPIFFGRGRETDALVHKVENERFVAVVGASGSGKSSLVAAGLLPRLKDKNASITRDWHYVRFTPGMNPLEALAEGLMDTVPMLGTDDPIDYPDRLEKLTNSLGQNSDRLGKTLRHALKNADEWVEVLIYVDQFEELFTLTTSDEERQAFIDLLTHPSDKIRIVITMRADFYHRAVPYLEVPLRTGSFTLDKPDQFALLDMIKRPAERAALDFEDGLPEQIVRDTGNEPGALALMAYALDELYHDCKDKQHLTFADYESLDGVQGAIGKRAESVFSKLSGTDEDKARLIGAVFNELVSVDERGVATRRRVVYRPEELPDDIGAMIRAFINARLLTSNEDKDSKESVLEVAHEALLRNWQRLADWIEETQDDIRLIRRIEREAHLWTERNEPEHMLPNAQELDEFADACTRLNITIDNDTVQRFTEPYTSRLLRELEIIDTNHDRRVEIGLELDKLGDPRLGIGIQNGVPDIVWCTVPAGQITIENKQFTIEPFYIAKCLVTYPQFQAFLDAEDGFNNDQWWQGLHKDGFKQSMSEQRQRYSNYPRDSVSWYQAMAFTHWLNYRLQGQAFSPENAPETSFVIGENLEIRLPTEWEWQFAATGDNPQNEYPWGKWDSRLANTSEAGVGRSTAVGMYLHGAAACGAMDVSGNLREWCLNDYSNLSIDISSINNKSLRGGAYDDPRNGAACAPRDSNYPFSRGYDYGLRVVCVPINNTSDL